MTSIRNHYWPHRTAGILLLLLAAFEVARGHFPAQPLGFVIGYLVAPRFWPLFYKVKSTFWSLLALFTFVIALSVSAIIIGILLKSYGAELNRCYFDGLHGLFLGLMMRAVFDKSMDRTAATHSSSDGTFRNDAAN